VPPPNSYSPSESALPATLGAALPRVRLDSLLLAWVRLQAFAARSTCLVPRVNSSIASHQRPRSAFFGQGVAHSHRRSLLSTLCRRLAMWREPECHRAVSAARAAGTLSLHEGAGSRPGPNPNLLPHAWGCSVIACQLTARPAGPKRDGLRQLSMAPTTTAGTRKRLGRVIVLDNLRANARLANRSVRCCRADCCSKAVEQQPPRPCAVPDDAQEQMWQGPHPEALSTCSPRAPTGPFKRQRQTDQWSPQGSRSAGLAVEGGACTRGQGGVSARLSPEPCGRIGDPPMRAHQRARLD